MHRYVLSDSVWCENNKKLTNPPSRLPDVLERDAESWVDMQRYIDTDAVHEDIVVQDTVSEILYAGDIHCLCGWTRDDVCLSHPDEVACEGWQTDVEGWPQLCHAGTYDSTHDFFTLLRVMEEGSNEDWMQYCAGTCTPDASRKQHICRRL